ncbi:hypothetical protein KAZ93_03140 [Patescibacteria group bacterium]|nr:hypothetical protein [Patescibacteria group bacterium]
MKKVVTEESAKEAKDKNLLALVGAMDNTQLQAFLDNLESEKLIDATRKADLSKVIKADNITKLATNYDILH